MFYLNVLSTAWFNAELTNSQSLSDLYPVFTTKRSATSADAQEFGASAIWVFNPNTSIWSKCSLCDAFFQRPKSGKISESQGGRTLWLSFGWGEFHPWRLDRGKPERKPFVRSRPALCQFYRSRLERCRVERCHPEWNYMDSGFGRGVQVWNGNWVNKQAAHRAKRWRCDIWPSMTIVGLKIAGSVERANLKSKIQNR